MQIIVFKLKDKSYALSTDIVEEITNNITSTSVPNTHQWIRGLVNLRGHVVTLLDLGFLLKHDDYLCYNNIIICKHQDEKVGLLVEDIIGVREIEPSMIKKISKTVDRGILGIVQMKDYIVNIIDVNLLLTEK